MKQQPSAPAGAASETARGRPKSASKNAQILEAASKLFVDQGFDGVSMDAIAAAADVSKQTIYSHFGGKEELFSQVVANKCVAYELSEEFLDPERPIRGMLEEIGMRFLKLLLSREALAVHRLLIESGDRHPSLAQRYFQAGPERMITLVSGYLRGQSRRGRFAVTDFRAAASQWLFMVKGEAHMCSVLHLPVDTDPEHMRGHVLRCVDVLLRAYPSPSEQ